MCCSSPTISGAALTSAYGSVNLNNLNIIFVNCHLCKCQWTVSLRCNSVRWCSFVSLPVHPCEVAVLISHCPLKSLYILCFVPSIQPPEKRSAKQSVWLVYNWPHLPKWFKLNCAALCWIICVCIYIYMEVLLGVVRENGQRCSKAITRNLFEFAIQHDFFSGYRNCERLIGVCVIWGGLSTWVLVPRIHSAPKVQLSGEVPSPQSTTDYRSH